MNKFSKFLVGTLFDEQQQDKKTNLSNMKAKDPMGNTRWKGAFTGGFQAGFKNTCGSKEGWTPSSFVSSVYKKAQATQRTIFDYMDKQDLGRQNISNNIVLNSNFQTFKNQSMTINLQQSIGQKILNKLKKIEAHRTAPQNQQEMQKLFQIYSKQQTIKPAYIFKDQIQPITVGSNPNQLLNDDFIDAYEDFYKKVIRQHSKEQNQEQIKKRRQQNKIYFDFTKPLDQEPQYLKQIQEVDYNDQPRKRKKNLINEQSLRSIFTQGVKFKQFPQKKQLDKIPEDYDPYSKMRKLQPERFQQKNDHKKPLTADKRSEILGEVKLSSKFVTSQNSLSNRFISNTKKVQQLQKFFQDEKKNFRYNEYIQEMEGKKISSQVQYMTYDEAQKEKNEFQEMYKSQKNNKQIQIKNEQKKRQKIRQETDKTFEISRTVESWRPQKLLCKRFNVLTPYTVKKQTDKKQYFYS